MQEVSVTTTYFSKVGSENTDRTLVLALGRARQLNIHSILVATTSGATGAKAALSFVGHEVIAVTHSAGFKKPDEQELEANHRLTIEKAGGKVLTCAHAFGGVNRAVRKKLNTYQLDEIIAFTLRIFGEGMKVVAEIALMSADAGLIRTDIPVICIAGTGHGADTAAIVLPTNSQTFFDLKILEVICRPSPGHPGMV